MFSILDLFKTGIGPSSSHTLGPMLAAGFFVAALQEGGLLAKVSRLAVSLHGSLALTGVGHHTDLAVMLGLAGETPANVSIEGIPAFIGKVRTHKVLPLACGAHQVCFDPQLDIVFAPLALPEHENGLRFCAYAGEAVLLEQVWYSVGGGVVVQAGQRAEQGPTTVVPYPYRYAAELLAHCRDTGYSLSQLVLQNELCFFPSPEAILGRCAQIWQTMKACMERGMRTEGLLPGPLRLQRRAPALRRLLSGRPLGKSNPLLVLDWVNMFALAVSEENAAGGRVVTAPTNGACGIIPAVLAYYNKFIQPTDPEMLERFFLAAGAIGLLFRMNASISGAEVGCQGEIGVACSMAAAGLAELSGATPEQVCTAAEIGMEHNLGLTCDPVGGQVQIPCIERNAINAVKAINAARMAMERSSTPAVSLDSVIAAMFATGKDMSDKYRETAKGGLAAVKGTGCE